MFSIQILTILAHIDHDIVGPFLKDIFQILLMVSLQYLDTYKY